MTGTASSAFIAERCARRDRAPALRLLFASEPADMAEARVAAAIAWHDSGAFDLTGLVVCRSLSRVIGAGLAVATPGRGVALWPTRVVADLPLDETISVHHVLLGAMEQHARRQRAKVASLNLRPGDAVTHVLRQRGYLEVMTMWEMRRLPGSTPPAPPNLSFASYSSRRRPEFLRMLDASYEESLDCPVIASVRSAEDSLVTHLAQNVENVPRAWLVKHWGEPAGCIFLAMMPDNNEMDIVYLGLALPHRGKGLGRELLNFAFREASTAGADAVTVRVDAANAPAVALYRRAGFQREATHEVFALVLEPNSA